MTTCLSCTMQVIPSVISAKTDSDAERRVFEDFKRVRAGGPDATVFHSLRLSKHEYKAEGELDFVIVCPEGLLFMEVKGGGVSRDERGIWTYTNRYGGENRNSEGPFNQVRSGMYSVMKKDNTIRHLSGTSEFGNIVYGYGVIFPDCALSDISSVEWDSAIILDSSSYGSASDLDDYVRNLLNYWRKKVNASHKRVIGGDHLDRIKNHFRPKFEKVPTLHHQGAKVASRMVELTEEQYRYLDQFPHNERILCFGGAGTGKTFLAAEIARRHSDEGARTLFTCRSRTLAANLASRLNGHQHVQVSAFSDLDGSAEDAYDVLIMDEGQDLLNFEALDVLDNILTGGIEHGTWRFFYDRNNQSGIYDSFEPEVEDFLKSCNATVLPLTRNCRNTHQIVLQIKMLTTADLGTPSAGQGPPVSYRYYDVEREAISLLHSWINDLLKDDVKHRHITILSPVPFDRSIASSLPESMRNQIEVLTDHNASQFPFNRISFSTIENFKGLENRFVSIVDIEEVDQSSGSMSQIYVSMSRAQVSLAFVVPENIKDIIEEIQINNSDYLSDDFKMS